MTVNFSKLNKYFVRLYLQTLENPEVAMATGYYG